MDAIQQHMIDSYRAAQRGELPPPLPGRHDWGVVREARERRRFEAVIAGRPAYGRRWAALRSLLGKLGRSGRSGRPGKSGKSGKLGKCRPSGA
ncbi:MULTISPECIES: hypothetical protein [unclassified Streptomyces]|uniref:hypothetical protein n=1 Tax=unclassified Streptomyces TaxID=2593676 RepID=UPI000F5BCEE2|nr:MULTISPECIES: hypothetical protein [unclassified Streptomyces]MCX5101511.1 hypothetical protein [Streptomyces sp. NBC_00439]RPK69319.1 hypothetical protein EES42_18955 [Streptomyces sp. ADI95-17]WSG51572.1 hypothetical protein OHA38_18205 [Streptomyces sp. NBC_01732]WSP48287.1 hypothetical protein OG348_21815 [Streptomyces sp. NBC_01243]